MSGVGHEIRLPSTASSAAEGRHWVLAHAVAYRVAPDQLPVVELLTSELVTNAVRHPDPATGITLSVAQAADELVVSVSDGDSRRPVVRPPDPERVGGNGMRIIDMLASAWGVETRGTHGKTVWFSTPLSSSSGPSV